MCVASILLLSLVYGQAEVIKVDQTLKKPQKVQSAKNTNVGIRGKLKPVTKEEFDRAAPQKPEGSLGSRSAVNKQRGQ